MSKKNANRVDRTCEECGKHFMGVESEIKRGGARYCSPRCYYNNRTQPLKTRFEKFIAPANETGCTIWKGSRNQYGYGQFHNTVAGSILATHVAWYIATGVCVPDGMWLLHKCDNAPCVNVAHLFLGTRQDNIDDMVAKGRQPRGETHYGAKLTRSVVVRIREEYAAGMAQEAIAVKYGVSRRTIGNVVDKHTWAHV